MIRTLDIPKERWPSFLQMINRLADGQPVHLEVADRELGDQEMAERLLPLQEIDYETKGSEAGQLIVTVGSERGELTHLVEAPAQLSLAVNDVDEPEFLAIAESNGAVTIVYFEHLPALEAEYTTV